MFVLPYSLSRNLVLSLMQYSCLTDRTEEKKEQERRLCIKYLVCELRTPLTECSKCHHRAFGQGALSEPVAEFVKGFLLLLKTGRMMRMVSDL